MYIHRNIYYIVRWPTVCTREYSAHCNWYLDEWPKMEHTFAHSIHINVNYMQCINEFTCTHTQTPVIGRLSYKLARFRFWLPFFFCAVVWGDGSAPHFIIIITHHHKNVMLRSEWYIPIPNAQLLFDMSKAHQHDSEILIYFCTTKISRHSIQKYGKRNESI